MKFYLTLFGFPTLHYAPAVRAAEGAGFEGIWLAEHLVTPTNFAKVYPYSASGDPGYRGDTPLADVWVTIGHLAAVTNRIKLASGVYSLPLRNPFATAKAVATAQELANGRVMLGVGTGWMQEEFDAVGQAYKGRGARTDEIIEIMRKLWSGKPVSHSGTWFSFDEVQMSPAPSPPPPIVIGGVSNAALARAVRFGDAWYGPSCSLEESAKYRDEILRRLSDAGRGGTSFDFYVRLNEQVSRESLSRANEFGFEHLVIPLSSSLSRLEEKSDRILRLGEQIAEATASLHVN